MRFTRFISGGWNAVCDQCGFRYKANELRKRWDGMMVCSHCYEIRHPQDFLKIYPENNKLSFTRPEVDGSNVGPASYAVRGCSLEGAFSQAEYGEADCMIVGQVNAGLIPANE